MPRSGNGCLVSFGFVTRSTPQTYPKGRTLSLVLFALAIEMHKHLRLSFACAYVWVALLALRVQGALPRE